MFEPENDIERLLMRAAADPAVRPDFARALMDTQMFVVLVSRRRLKIVPGPDGNAVIPAGAKLSDADRHAWRRKAVTLLHRAVACEGLVQGRSHRCAGTTRDLFERSPNGHFVLNPGSDFGKEFTPGEVKRLLAGHSTAARRPSPSRSRSRCCWRTPRKRRST